MTTRFWGNEISVNSTTTGNQSQSSITALPDGGFLVAWTDFAGTDSVIKWQRFSAIGAKVGNEVTIFSLPGSDYELPHIGLAIDGNILASFNLDGFVSANSLNFNGLFVSSVPSQISGGASAGILVVPGATIVLTVNNLGQLYCIYSDPQTNGFFVQSSFVNPSSQPSVAVRSNGGDFALAYQTGGDGDVVAVVLSGTLTQTGLFVIASDFGVQTDVTGAQGAPSVAWINNDQFVVAWQSDMRDGSFLGVRAGIYNANGTTAVAEFGVNTVTNGDQMAPTVTGLENGGFVISWVDVSSIGADTFSGIKLQAFDALGNKVGQEFLVNTTTADVQNDPQIAALADGRIVVSWTDNSQGHNEIKAQIIDTRNGGIYGNNNANTMYGNEGISDEMFGYDGADVLSGLSGADILNGGNGNDTLNGGRGDDTLYGGADQDSMIGGLGVDELDGGAGVDTANYALASFAVTASLDGTLLGTNEAAFDNYVSIENLTGSNLAAQGDTLRGNAAANSIAGLAGNDSLNGAAGHDRLTGGTGTDTMTGGIGNDSFIYNTLAETSDIITDFSSFAANNNDVFRFKGSVFGGLAAGAITAPQFQSSTADVAANTNIRFFYETDTRILRFDADGSDPGAAVTIATMQVGATMTFNDILIF